MKEQKTVYYNSFKVSWKSFLEKFLYKSTEVTKKNNFFDKLSTIIYTFELIIIEYFCNFD